MTQPLGHSTSGSHERYKSKERLKFEEEFDPIKKMKEWILEEKIADIKTLDKIEDTATLKAKEAQSVDWGKYLKVFLNEKKELLNILNTNLSQSINVKELSGYDMLVSNNITTRKEIASLTKKILQLISKESSLKVLQKDLASWLIGYEKKGQEARSF